VRVRLVCWNLAGRVRLLDEQVREVLSVGAELVCLQELTATTLPRWRAALADAGYLGIEHAAGDGERQRPLSVLTASRVAQRRVEVEGVPWPERVLASRLSDGIEVINVHSPISPKPNEAKLRTHLAVHAHLAADVPHPRLLCGDLNTPRRELPDGTIWTFARDRYGRLRPERGERWEQAELSLLRGLEPYGFSDAFRRCHGPELREISWGWPRWKGGYRLDHLIVAGFSVHECRYEHSWRERGLSDHSALLATLQPDSRFASANTGTATETPT
jgi:endonuclease/exonuclease/phosphatase family metal-dependent hydrolase